MLLMQYAAVLAASQPALRSLLTRAVWLTRHDPCVCRHDRLSISGEHCHQRDRGLGATIDQAGPRLGLVEQVVGTPLPQRRHYGKQTFSHLGEGRIRGKGWFRWSGRCRTQQALPAVEDVPKDRLRQPGYPPPVITETGCAA